MANIQQRLAKGGDVSYRVQVRLLGFPVQRATFKRKTDAKAWAQQVESAIREGRHLVTNEAKKHTLAALIERHLEALQPKKPHAYLKQRQLLYWWKERLGARALAHITPAVIAEQRDALLSGNIGTKKEPRYRAPPTANRYLAALSKGFSVAVREWHWLKENPVSMVQKEKESAGIVRFVSDTERAALIKACGKSPLPELELIVMLALTTGMRRSEIRMLRWPDLDMKRGTIVIQKTKNQERRAVPMVPPVLALLGKHGQVRHLHTDLVFARSDSNDTRPIDFDHAFIDAVKAAKIKNFRFHDCRHTAASYLAMSHATLAEIAAVLGHKTLAMVKRYAHLSDQHTHEVVNRMTQKYFG
jgi:integrase